MTITSTTLTAASLLTLATLSAHAWTPGVGSESDTIGFSVDTQSRNDVISFWNCVYMESEGFENFGTSSQNFKNDVQRRINYYRAMAGMSASLDLTNSSTILINSDTPSGAQPAASATKAAAAQAAAEMLAANSSQFLAGGGVATGAHDPHNPPLSWFSDTNIARNGAFHSNLAIGIYGPAAIDAYISEDDIGPAGAENDEVGHRRLIFQSRLQEIATGDIEPTGNNFSANALYMRGNLLSNAPAQFIPWPNAGYIPEDITPERWSLSYPDADFTSATVTATGPNGSNIPVTIQSTTANFGDETIIWEFNSDIPSAESGDQAYDITVSNISIDRSSVEFSYQVTIINPDRLLESTDLSGSINPPDTGANYFFDPVEQAEEFELDVSSRIEATWFEGAEDGTDGLIIDETDDAYELLSSFTTNGITPPDFWDTGDNAFRLAFPRNELDAFQEFQINRTLIPRVGGSLTFRLRRGFMAPNTRLSVQSSTDGGAIWSEIDHYSGNSNNQVDTGFSTQSVPLADTGQNTLVRFVLHQPANTGVFNLVDNSAFPIGAFVDGIEPINCDVLESLPATRYSADTTSVPLDSVTGGGTLIAGNPYILRLRVKIGCEWFPFGESLEVIPVASNSLSEYELWFRGQFPIIGGFTDDFDQDGIPNALERIFDLDPTNNSDGSSILNPQITGSNLELSHPIIEGATVNAEYSSTLEANDWLPLGVTISNGTATASIPLSTAPNLFIRWTTDE